jgi:4-hydroxyphenylpyruvate dioxygenase
MSEFNPIGLDGLEFIEFASANLAVIESLVESMGSVLVAKHKQHALRLYRQNDVNFIINNESDSFGVEFARLHGPSACSMGFRVRDAEKAFSEAVRRGAKPVLDETKKAGLNLPAVYGIGGAIVYFVDRYEGSIQQASKVHGGHTQTKSISEIYDDGKWEWLGSNRRPVGKGLSVIDHMTNNVPVGEMQKWCDFYTQIFGFQERRFFDIKGKATGLISKVMKSPCGKFSIPINEPSDPKSQIQEYLDEYKGSGIQHIALLTEDIAVAIRDLRKSQVFFLKGPPHAYYESVTKRVPTVNEDLTTMENLGVLIDGDEKGYLLQIFTKNMVGPIFLEIIQRRRHEGFGEGNFQALFDSIEEDQRQRGVL